MRRLVLAALLLTACATGGPQIRYQTTHGVAVAGETLPAQADVERWTGEVADAFGRADCAELRDVTADAALAMIRYSADRHRAVRLLWAPGQPYATGRFLQAHNAVGFRHELVHALLGGLGHLERNHHDIMERCKVP